MHPIHKPIHPFNHVSHSQADPPIHFIQSSSIHPFIPSNRHESTHSSHSFHQPASIHPFIPLKRHSIHPTPLITPFISMQMIIQSFLPSLGRVFLHSSIPQHFFSAALRYVASIFGRCHGCFWHVYHHQYIFRSEARNRNDTACMFTPPLSPPFPRV